MAGRQLTELAAAVTDGNAIDWPAVRAGILAPDDHDIATALEAVSDLRATGQSNEAAPDRRLPAALEFIRFIAVFAAVTGGCAEVIAALFLGRTGRVLFTVVLLAFASAAIYLDLGGKDRRARALAACYWMVAASFSSSVFRYLTLQAHGAAWLRIVTGLRPETLLAAGLWQFTREFPVLTRFSRLDRVCGVALRIATLVGLVFFAGTAIVAIAPRAWIALALAPLDGLRTPPNYIYWDAIFVFSAPALITMGLRARSAESREKRLARFFLYAIICSFLPIVLEVLAEGFFPSYRRMMRRPLGQLLGSLIIYPAQIALPLVTAYAVVVDDVLDVQVVVQRGLRYLLAKALIAWSTAIPFAGLLFYVYIHRDQPLSESLATGQARILTWVGGIALLLLLLRSKLVYALDRWALPGLEDGATMLATMAGSLKNTRTRIEVVTALMTAAERALQAPAEGYLSHNGRLVPMRADAAPPPHDSVIPVLIEGARGPCIVAPEHRHSYNRLLTDQDRRWIAAEQIAVLVPVLASRGRGGLVGMVGLKSRRNAMAFSMDDLRFLSAGSASASLASDLLDAEGQTPAASASADIDELAKQCEKCGRVAAWTSSDTRCACGGGWDRAALPQQVLRRFTVTQLLGRGGMGIVYRATDITLQRDVAVKTLTRLSEDAATRLIDEARTMGALSHTNIAVLYGAEMWRNTPILVMEYLGGGTLAAKLRRGQMSADDAVQLVRVLAQTLERLHTSGMYHGDIKPTNIGFSADGTPKFLDFGLSRAIASTTAPVGGTPAYLSPEVRAGAQPGPALDVWALSIVLCECLTGQLPSTTRGEWSSLPPATHAFLANALSTEASRYPHTASQFVAALEGLHV